MITREDEDVIQEELRATTGTFTVTRPGMSEKRRVNFDMEDGVWTCIITSGSQAAQSSGRGSRRTVRLLVKKEGASSRQWKVLIDPGKPLDALLFYSSHATWEQAIATAVGLAGSNKVIRRYRFRRPFLDPNNFRKIFRK